MSLKLTSSSAAEDRGASRCFGYDTPYRCLLSVGVPNVLSSGRCISAAQEGMAGAGVMGRDVTLGQAAGTAAALAARYGADPAAVDVRGLRDALRRDGQLV